MRYTLLFILLVLLNSCSRSFQLSEGDLLFQSNDEGALSSAIDEATGRKGEVSFSHVGIVSIEEDGIYVLEAEPREGVRLTPLQVFLDASAHDADGSPLVVVKRLNDSSLASMAVKEGKKYLGQPYDFTYLPENGAMYCSELVYESFLDNEGNHLLQSKAMTFKNAQGVISDYWIQLFEKLHMEVPEGVEGTNPNDMLLDPALIEVFRYY